MTQTSTENLLVKLSVILYFSFLGEIQENRKISLFDDLSPPLFMLKASALFSTQTKRIKGKTLNPYARIFLPFFS